eukprot:124834-Hanusia_phi.AAC.1
MLYEVARVCGAWEAGGKGSARRASNYTDTLPAAAGLQPRDGGGTAGAAASGRTSVTVRRRSTPACSPRAL